MDENNVLSNETKDKPNSDTQNQVKLSHKERKALLKKQKRKIKRQNEAVQREQKIEEDQKKKEQSPTYLANEKQRQELEQLKVNRERAEKIYLNKVWMEKERISQEEFERKKKWEIKEKIKRMEIEKKIKEEWEEQQKQEEERKEKETEKKKHQDSLLKQATANENKDKDGPWHNPIATLLPGKEKETCPFFAKTGACRFGERCSRGHPIPETSTTVLMRGMYSNFELEQGLLEENDTDLILEYEDSELYNNFKEFYDDIVPEFEAVGRVTQVKVCCNYEPHLRGNVYIQYNREEDAHLAMMKMNGRFYGGKQISCEPVNIKSWKSAICGLFGKGRCPKGRNCNFLHVFKNPRNEYWQYDKPLSVYGGQSERSSRYSRSRSKSPYSRRSCHRQSYSRNRSKDTYSSRSRYRSRSNRYSRSRSRSPSRSRSNSRSRSKSKLGSHKRHSHYKRRDSRSTSKSPKSEKYPNKRLKKTNHPRPRSREREYSKSRSRSVSKNRSVSRSPSRHKRKKHKHKKHKHHKSERNSSEINGQEEME